MNNQDAGNAQPREIPETGTWDHSSHSDFYNYYERESLSDTAIDRIRAMRDTTLRIANVSDKQLVIADIGCGAGTGSRVWAEAGHRVYGLDVNAPLIALARDRALAASLKINFEVGSATALPWPDASVDICVVPELLEHVRDWQACLSEFTRVLKPGGVLYISTSNKLCPIQEEFNLPLYSWYPGFLKRRFERLAMTSRPELANYAKYPAVNWFSFFSLRAYLGTRGFVCRDRFDVMEMRNKGAKIRLMRSMIIRIGVLRFLAHMATSYTMLLAIKTDPANRVANPSSTSNR